MRRPAARFLTAVAVLGVAGLGFVSGANAQDHGNPDTFCSDTDAPPANPPAFCELYPTDPACKPE